MNDISEGLATVLRSARDELNASFAQAKKQYPALDGPAFLSFLARCVDPVVAAVQAREPERVADVVRAGYAVGLELVGQRAALRSPAIELCFQRVLPPLAALLAHAPERVIGALVNAAYNLDGAGARTQDWLDAVATIGPRCPNVEALLQLGQLCAWRAGLAHYRSTALELAGALPPEIARAALGLPDGASFSQLRAAFERDPWFVPDAAPNPRVVAAVGGFRGYGGLFREPPRVHAHGGQFVVRSGDASWLLIADAFGATFHRASAEEQQNRSSPPPPPSGWKLEGNTLITPRARLVLPIAGQITSFARNAHTLALSSSFTHSIVLVAIGGVA
jgi:hypothetical protein